MIVVVVVVERVRRNVHLLVELRWKLVASRPATVTTNHQMQQLQQEPSGVSSGVWLPRLSQDDFDRVVQTTPSGLLAVSDVYSCAHVAHSRKIPINPSAFKLSKKCTISQPIASINKPVNIHTQRHTCHII